MLVFTKRTRSSLLLKVGLTLAIVFLAVIMAEEAFGGGNCDNTQVGLTPINDLGADFYQGYQAGLYPGGVNEPPYPLDSISVAIGNSIQPLDTTGAVDPENGALVFVTIGMSNAKAESQWFVILGNDDLMKNPKVSLINGADPGKTADLIADPENEYWDYVQEQVAKFGFTNKQVQAVWVKEATPFPSEPFPTETLKLQGFYEVIARNLKALFPNLKIAYYSSRIYAGYATGGLNPEPHAYETAFAVKWMIEKQMAGDMSLNFDPAKGEVVAPLILWGPYLWADGLNPRSDSLIWQCEDMANDGTHPSDSGSVKVADLLLEFLRTNPTSISWYLKDGLPVELVDFAAVVRDANVELTWLTATETDNLGFEIQRKTDGQRYSRIAFVQGNGSTLSPESYRYRDANLPPGTYVYRLKQIDFDGSWHLSKEIAATVPPPRAFALTAAYPNPFTARTAIGYQLAREAHISIKIMNVLGQEITTLAQQGQRPGEFQVQWDGLDRHNQPVADGIYLVTFLVEDAAGTPQLIDRKKILLLR